MKHAKRNIVFCSVIAVIFFLTGALWAGETEKININKASVEELVQLNRIGPKYAARIVEYREKNGPFKAPEDITNVSGIGPKTYELNMNRITVD